MAKDILLSTELNDTDKWNFDNKFLSEMINIGKNKLTSNKLSRRTRQSLRADIETLERFIIGNYEFQEPTTYNLSLPKNIDKLKDYIIMRMQKQYKTLGKDLIKWIMNLAEEHLFEETLNNPWVITNLSLEEQAELTIKNYENNSIKFLEPAKEIILDKSIKQIQSVEFSSTYCHHDTITDKSFIIINSSDVSCLFNHEVQHAIEMLLKFPTNRLYNELGAIYFEMFFNEELYKARGCLESGDFEFRFEETANLLYILYDYFKILLLFAEKNFDISTDEFLQAFITHQKINPSLLEDYLKEEIANDNVVDDMKYLFSFLKAIELREKTVCNKDKNSEMIEHYLKNKNFVFKLPKDGFKVYERYTKEMNQKIRRKTKQEY